jgi:hypothetical protein
LHCTNITNKFVISNSFFKRRSHARKFYFPHSPPAARINEYQQGCGPILPTFSRKQNIERQNHLGQDHFPIFALIQGGLKLSSDKAFNSFALRAQPNRFAFLKN